MRGQVTERDVIVILHVHDHHGLHAHALAKDVHRNGVEVAAVDEQVARVLVPHGR